jgi:hypothetical protein
MNRAQIGTALLIVSTLAVMPACEAKKSSNPLSPNIAGPIPGVEISQPKLLEPGQGWKFKSKQLPLTLLIENASSNGPRPLVYGIQIALDAGFKNITWSRRDIPPGTGGRTSLRMPDKLQLGRTYYWRAWAYDGANTSAMSRSVSFEVYPPVTIHAPELSSPANSATGVPVSLQLTVRNSSKSGPAGNIRYRYQVASSSSFGDLVTGNSAQPENVSAGRTIWHASGLQHNQTYYWRVQATDGETTSGWSSVWRFTTSGAPEAPADPGEACGPPYPTDPFNIVKCRRSQYPTPMSESQTVAMLRGIASDLNAMNYSGGPYGILVKTGGSNCNGYSCDIICAGNGGSQVQYDVLGDAEDRAYPTWNGPLDTIVVRTCEIR